MAAIISKLLPLSQLWFWAHLCSYSIEKCFPILSLSFSGVSLEYWGDVIVCHPAQFCRAERKKDLGRFCALHLWLLFPIPTSVSEWTPSQDSHRSFLHVHNMVLPGESQGQRSLLGCPLWAQSRTRLTWLSRNKVYGASLVAQLVKNPPGLWETWVPSMGWEDLLENRTATLSSILAWRIPQTI